MVTGNWRLLVTVHQRATSAKETGASLAEAPICRQDAPGVSPQPSPGRTVKSPSHRSPGMAAVILIFPSMAEVRVGPLYFMMDMDRHA